MSVHNLTKEYWQLPLHLSDQKYTEFAILWRQFHFVVMPLWLHGVPLPATFQQLVDDVLTPCEGFYMAYLDDIIIFSKT